eukprot:3795436-Prymnesium_polylepis.1
MLVVQHSSSFRSYTNRCELLCQRRLLVDVLSKQSSMYRLVMSVTFRGRPDISTLECVLRLPVRALMLDTAVEGVVAATAHETLGRVLPTNRAAIQLCLDHPGTLGVTLNLRHPDGTPRAWPALRDGPPFDEQSDRAAVAAVACDGQRCVSPMVGRAEAATWTCCGQ